MKKAITSMTVIALFAFAAPASAGKAVRYQGTTNSGNKITFKLKNGRIHDLTADIHVSCIPSYGGGRPLVGSEQFGFSGSLRLKRHMTFSFVSQPTFTYDEVKMKHDLWEKSRGPTITGRMRLQYSFLALNHPIGGFTTYGCLGRATFKANART